MLASSYSRFGFAVLLISFLCYIYFSKWAVGVAFDIRDMESSDESHLAKREISRRKEKKKLKRKFKKLKHKQQSEKDRNLERKKSGRKEKRKDIKRKENKKKNKKEKIRLEKSVHSRKIPKKKTSKKKRKKWSKSKNGSRERVEKKGRRRKGESKVEAVGREETDCVSTLFKYSNLNSKKVPTIVKQVKLIEKSFGVLEKKIGKKEAFKNHFLALEAALSECNMTKNQSFANQTLKATDVLQILGNCSVEIEKRCSNTLNSSLNATVSNFIEVALRFSKQMKDCSNSSLSTNESPAFMSDGL